MAAYGGVQLAMPLVEEGGSAKIAAFDIETTSLPADFNSSPLGSLPTMTCGAVIWSDGYTEEIRVWRADCLDSAESMVEILDALLHEGYRVFSFNGAGFDCRVLAGQVLSRAGRAALRHVTLQHHDLMAMVVQATGGRVSLNACLRGMGLEQKLHRVTLSNGEVLTSMSGRMAPELWARGEYEAVIEYLTQDVVTTLSLARMVEHTESIAWAYGRKRNGTPVAVLPVGELLGPTARPETRELVAWMKAMEAAPPFDGVTFDEGRDARRMGTQLQAVYDCMRDGDWWTLRRLQDELAIRGIESTETAVSARIRDLRKGIYGAHTVEGEHVINGLWRYRLVGGK